MQNCSSQEFFGPDPMLLQRQNTDTVQLCSTKDQKDSSEWTLQLWDQDKDKDKEKKKKLEKGLASRHTSKKFVLRNSSTLKYLSVGGKKGSSVTWKSLPEESCIFVCHGPGVQEMMKVESISISISISILISIPLSISYIYIYI